MNRDNRHFRGSAANDPDRAAAPEIVIVRRGALLRIPAPHTRHNASQLLALQTARRAKAGRETLTEGDGSPGFLSAKISAFSAHYEENLTKIAARPFMRLPDRAAATTNG